MVQGKGGSVLLVRGPGGVGKSRSAPYICFLLVLLPFLPTFYIAVFFVANA